MTRISGNCGICQCLFESGDCIHISAEGVVTPIIKDVDGNMVEYGPAGLAAFLADIYENPPAVHIYSSVPQPMPSNASQPLFFNEVRYDTDSMFDEDRFSSRLQMNTPGIYFVTINVRWSKTNDSTATGDMVTALRKNGADQVAIDAIPVPEGDSFAKQSVSYLGPFSADDYIEAICKHDIEIDDEPQIMYITDERMSPNFTAVFMRPITGMSILGMDT